MNFLTLTRVKTMTLLTGFPREILIYTFGEFLNVNGIMRLHFAVLSKERRYLEEDVYPEIEVNTSDLNYCDFFKDKKFKIINISYPQQLDSSFSRPEIIKVVDIYQEPSKEFKNFLLLCVNLKELDGTIFHILDLDNVILKRLTTLRLSGSYRSNIISTIMEKFLHICCNITRLQLSDFVTIYSFEMLTKLQEISLKEVKTYQIDSLKVLKHLHSFRCTSIGCTFEQLKELATSKKWNSFEILDGMLYSLGYLNVGQIFPSYTQEEFIEFLKLFEGIKHLAFNYTAFRYPCFSKVLINSVIKHNKLTLTTLEIRNETIFIDSINLYNITSLTLDYNSIDNVCSSKKVTEFTCKDDVDDLLLNKILRKFPNIKTLNLSYTFPPFCVLFKSKLLSGIEVRKNSSKVF